MSEEPWEEEYMGLHGATGLDSSSDDENNEGGDGGRPTKRKKQTAGEPGHELTPSQRERCEQERATALDRRRQKQAATALTEEQLKLCEANRAQALARRGLKRAAEEQLAQRRSLQAAIAASEGAGLGGLRRAMGHAEP